VVPAVRARMEGLSAPFDGHIVAIAQESARAQDAAWAAAAAVLLGRAARGAAHGGVAPGEHAHRYERAQPGSADRGRGPRAAAVRGGDERTGARGSGLTATDGRARPCIWRRSRPRAPTRRSRRSMTACVASTAPTGARCAAARPLLRLAWAVVRIGQAFDPAYGQRQMEVAYTPLPDRLCRAARTITGRRRAA